jgi:hypothetical protein
MKRNLFKIFLFTLGIILIIIVSLQIGKGNITTQKLKMLSYKLFLPRTVEDWNPYLFNTSFKYCDKKIAHEMKPEFSRAISLIVQRIQESSKQYDEFNIELGAYPLGLIINNKNCLDIQYAPSVSDMSGADGLFLFSSEFSDKNRLKILVSPEYKAQDDLMTALLLSHEITHAEQFINEDVFNNEIARCHRQLDSKFCKEVEDSLKELLVKSCFVKEQEAFYQQFYFYMKLKDSEHSTLMSKYIADYQSKYNLPVVSLMNTYTNLILSTCSPSITGNPWGCINDYFGKSVVETPFYQEQCVGLQKANQIINELNNLATPSEKSSLFKKYVNEGVIDVDTSQLLNYLLKNK